MSFQAQASLDIPNHRGDTPLSMLQNYVGSVWVGAKVADRIREAARRNHSHNILFKITKDKVMGVTLKIWYFYINEFSESEMVVYGGHSFYCILYCRFNTRCKFINFNKNVSSSLFIYNFTFCWSVIVRR